MGFATSKIQLGAARIFVGVTAAATGTPPTYTTHTAGVPASGTEIGLTQGDTMFEYKAEQKLIEAEQALGYVQSFSINERAFVEFNCLEYTYNTLKQAMNGVGTESISAGDAFWFGGGTGILLGARTCVFITSLDPNNPTKYKVIQLYSAATTAGMNKALSRTKETVYKVRFDALQDMTRNAGDQMGYFRLEKP